MKIISKARIAHELSSVSIAVAEYLLDNYRLVKNNSKKIFHSRKCCYEVGVEFLKTFNNSINKVNDKYYLDLTKNIKQFSFENNINLEDTDVCTICNKEYFSYRKNKTSERQFSFIWI